MKRASPRIADKSIPVGALVSLPAVLQDHGVDPWPLLGEFGIHPESFKQHLSPLPVLTHGRILEAAAAASGCDHLGLLLGQRANLQNAGPLRFLVLNASTVRAAMESLIRYCGLWYRGLHLNLVEERGYAGLRLSIVGNVPGSEQLLTAYLAAIVTIMQLVVGKAWRPALVRITYRKPPSAALYEQCFRCPVWFGQSQHEVLFPQALLDTPRSGHDQQLDDFLRSHLNELQGREGPDLPSRVRQVIEALLLQGECSVERVAEFFAVHRFTLYRYLSEHHTSFEVLLEQTRKDMAARLLIDPQLPIAEVASRLGYDTQGNFSRAFKRWFACTPRDWRKAGAKVPK
ncbi:DNA-binding domain-containing protein, AraC-type [Pseudomonas sp. GM84]|uniref:AraC family transcriptional regulator n=1 Tax=Pseudomonas sp. GM84 TaxID=1144340 RepID=UPI00026FB563|nr:AraC family transcriptional regulator [Pseudomonas sp. GM84]EJN40376.1 DNA-binding domain-containing protein, AraC-type [Pseudomonas sp. GM84]